MTKDDRCLSIVCTTMEHGEATPTHKMRNPCAIVPSALLQSKQDNDFARSEKPDYCTYTSLSAWIPGFGRRIGGI